MVLHRPIENRPAFCSSQIIHVGAATMLASSVTVHEHAARPHDFRWRRRILSGMLLPTSKSWSRDQHENSCLRRRASRKTRWMKPAFPPLKPADAGEFIDRSIGTKILSPRTSGSPLVERAGRQCDFRKAVRRSASLVLEEIDNKINCLVKYTLVEQNVFR